MNIYINYMLRTLMAIKPQPNRLITMNHKCASLSLVSKLAYMYNRISKIVA